MSKKNLIIAAHPDDEILGCGGLIPREIEKQNPCYVLVLTDGSAGRYGQKKASRLKKSTSAAHQILGTTEIIVEQFPNQALETVPITAIAQCLEKHIQKICPTSVYTHHGGDLNHDHQIVYEASLVACRPFYGQKIRELYSYNVPSSTEWRCIEDDRPFIPNVFVDIGRWLDKKISAMKTYATEYKSYPHPRSAESLKAHANYWGLTVGMEYAEPFRLIRWLK